MNASQKRFAEEYGMPYDTVEEIACLSRRREMAAEFVCNGEPHKVNQNNPSDKNRNSELWQIKVNAIDFEILQYAKPYGFTEVVCTGLGPTLKRGEQFVEIPY